MLARFTRAFEQLGHLRYEVSRVTRESWWRWGTVGFTNSFWAVASYRLSRAGYLALGNGWPAARVALAPALFALKPWAGGCEIHYRAEIGRGLRVLHPNLGVVISAETVAGDNLILVGGNCIGRRENHHNRGIVIGNNVLLGANASIIGPCTIGDDVKIGAGATVVRDAANGEILIAPPPEALAPSRSRAS